MKLHILGSGGGEGYPHCEVEAFFKESGILVAFDDMMLEV